MIPIFWRYLTLRFLKTATFVLISICAILMTMRLGDIAHFASLGSNSWAVLVFFLYQIPFILPIALPIALLVSSFTLAQKLSDTEELTALRMKGASLFQIFTPIWLVSALLVLGNFYLVSELQTEAHLKSHLLKAKSLSVNPLHLAHNKHLMSLKGAAFIPLGGSKHGKSAKDALIAFPDDKSGRFRLLFAKSLKATGHIFEAKELFLVNETGQGELFFDRTGKFAADSREFSPFIESKVFIPTNDQLPLKALVLKENYARSEIVRRISLALAAFTFTLVGISFGLKRGRQFSRKNLFFAFFLCTLMLACYFLAKGLEDKFEAATIVYLFPHVILVIASLYMLTQYVRGVVTGAKERRYFRMFAGMKVWKLPFLPLWERYLLSKFLRTAAFFILSFFTLYILIDFATHARGFFHLQSASIKDLADYYGMEVIRRIGVLLPFALLLATIKTLLAMNQKRELVALLAGGISLKRIALPLIILGTLFSTLLYLNEETLLPKAEYQLGIKGEERLRKKGKASGAKTLVLSNGTKLIYQTYDREAKQFCDVIWMDYPRTLWRIETLKLESIAQGEGVEEYALESFGPLFVRSVESQAFPALKIPEAELWKSTVRAADLPLTQLYSTWKESMIGDERKSEMATGFIYRIIAPWFCLLAILLPLNGAVKFSRNTPDLMLFAMSLFFLEAAFILLDAGKTLGERQTVDPFYALVVPFGLIFLGLGVRFFRMRGVSV